jgi:hypothetical protein
MKFKDKELFKKNVTYLFSIAKRAGIDKGQVCKELGIHTTTPYYWAERGTISDPVLNNFINFFKPWIPDLNPEMLGKIDLAERGQLRVIYPKKKHPQGEAEAETAAEGEEITEEEKRIIRTLRSWHPHNRQLIIDLILKLK